VAQSIATRKFPFDRNGFAYVVDAADGTLLRATKYLTTDWAEKIDLKTGRPIKVREHSPYEVGRNVSICPSAMGGKDQQPGAVDPKEPNIFYMSTNNWCMELEPQERTQTNQERSTCSRTCTCIPRSPALPARSRSTMS
jgi:lanthanide-dependent methanol dehydrogenase